MSSAVPAEGEKCGNEITGHHTGKTPIWYFDIGISTCSLVNQPRHNFIFPRISANYSFQSECPARQKKRTGLAQTNRNDPIQTSAAIN